LHGKDFISYIWEDLPTDTLSKQKALWQEVTSLIGGARVLSSAAEATSITSSASKQIKETVWIADGVQYSRWLARNIINWLRDLQKLPEGSWKPLSELFSKSLRLGYPGRL
jgi:telomere length regulation protein